MSEATASISESTSEASTVTEPVASQAASLPTISTPATVTEAPVARRSSCARRSGERFSCSAILPSSAVEAGAGARDGRADLIGSRSTMWSRAATDPSSVSTS